MEEKLKININIGERNYPININMDNPDVEAVYRSAAKDINASLMRYRDKYYRTKDEQDFLAMTLLNYAVKLKENDMQHDLSDVVCDLKRINFDIEDFIDRLEE